MNHNCNIHKVTYVNYIFVTFVKIEFIMEDRLLKLLDTEQLTSAKFADAIGVQRSSVSHILSGRNKPSFDFLQKTLKAFPMLNADWLILGEGNMYEGEVHSFSGSLFDQVTSRGRNEASSNSQNREEVQNNLHELTAPDVNISGSQYPDPEKSSSADVKDGSEDQTRVTSSESSERESSHNHAGTRSTADSERKNFKAISRVIVFYTDNSFESYEKAD